MLISSAGIASAQSWQFRTYTQDGGARAGTISQAEVKGRDGTMLRVSCGYDAMPWIAFRFGGDEPNWPGRSARLLAHVRGKSGTRSFDLGSMQYSLSAYSAHVPPGLIAALMSGSHVTIEGPELAFDAGFGLAGSTAALNQLDCI